MYAYVDEITIVNINNVESRVLGIEIKKGGFLTM